ncbi:DNA polymerase IV [Paucilactobacillus oligofermentans DSM 15707 = LMG 22743]|uniref:DNA polymerase IV n=1 Tax=Paucilactobacillus oligofermentans DSM 15707 = LMG 22743 TaxID=1423778 RepID=A0A0R1RMZ6_9LACO|nr:DNA polymerase IV [Paucilactobacillus oligofermentans]KRL57969.1 DNA polymerase IV [Paucilactobacillus oligofermentans DSM 15707 = LMG 22743]CUS26559.1 DNA polymerase IV [Paucilactobacillus oligofermentans DSM 15707 = LMG 22743]
MTEFMQQQLNIDTTRKIIHIDMDAFYAQIEMRDHPEWREKPLVIAKDPRKTGGHGVVATANYVARKAGIHSAMSAAKALELEANAVFKTPDFTLYRRISAQVHEIFHRYTDIVEPIAFDEAYLDVTDNKLNISNPVVLAHRLQAEIFEETKLTCSTGISYNKFLAKLASEYRKPVGVTVINPDDVKNFLFKLPIDDFRGVGKKTVPKMYEMGINNGADLFEYSESDLMAKFGKMGYILYRRVRGEDDRPVEYQRDRKSIGKERTYTQLINSEEGVQAQLTYLSELVADALKANQKHGKTVVLKIRYQDFSTITKRDTMTEFVDNTPEAIYFVANQIYEELPKNDDSVRLLGITLTNLSPSTFENITLPLFKH